MTDEEIWLKAFFEYKDIQFFIRESHADRVLKEFRTRFPTAPIEFDIKLQKTDPDIKYETTFSTKNTQSKRREFWVDVRVMGTPVAHSKRMPDTIHVIEIAPNEIVISKADLAKAWDTHQCQFTSSTDYNKFLNALGFPSEAE